jgi:hypothetical protein
MTLHEAARILESLAERYRDPRALEAFRLAREALQNDVETTIGAIHHATGRDVTVQSIRDPDGGGVVNAWVHRGASCSAPTLPEALAGLLEKVTGKVAP